jgi:competence protein ComEC
MTAMFWAGSAYLCGIYAGITRLLPAVVWPMLLICLVVVIGTCYRREVPSTRMIALMMLWCFGAGAWTGSARPTASEMMRPYRGRNHIFTGRPVPGSFSTHDNRTSFLLELDQGICLRVIVKGKKALPSWGQFSIRGRLEPIQGFYNPGVPLEEIRAASRRIGGVLKIGTGDIVCLPAEPTLRESVFAWGDRPRNFLRKNLPPQDSALLEGMLLGGSKGLDGETTRLFTACGLSHLLSVSGTHVALLLSFFFYISRTLHLNRVVTVAAASLLLCAYAVLCGLRGPVCRAVILGLAAAGGKIMKRKASGASFLGASAAVMLAWNPYWLLDIGFQLSFGAAAGLLFLRRPFACCLSRYFPRFLAEGLSVPLAAQALTLPLLVYHFHWLSLISVLANVIIVPILSFCLLGTVFAVAAGLLFPFPASVLLAVVAQFAGAAMELARLLLYLPGTAWVTGNLCPLVLPFYGLLLALLVVPDEMMRKFPFGKRALFGVTCTGLVIGLFSPLFYAQPLTAYFLDVGQGDCALVVTPERETILVDTGGLAGRFDTGERIIVPVMRYLGLSEIDYLILSHGHHDHAGGAAGTARWIPIDRILLPREGPSPDMEKLLSVIQHKNSFVHTMRKGQSYPLKNGSIRIIEAPEVSGTEKTGNENSAVVQVVCSGHSLLFTGDATGEIELSAAAGPIRSDVLKISHHGSSTSSELAFLKAAAPELAVISAGRHNRFGHPHAEVLQRLHFLGIPFVRTDRKGAVKIILDDDNPSWYSYIVHCQKSRWKKALME